jgi:hypothetical protein
VINEKDVKIQKVFEMMSTILLRSLFALGVGDKTDYTLLTATKDPKCILCRNYMRKPVIARCGHVYCSSCINDWIEKDQKAKFEKEQKRIEDEQKMTLGVVGHTPRKVEIKVDPFVQCPACVSCGPCLVPTTKPRAKECPFCPREKVTMNVNDGLLHKLSAASLPVTSFGPNHIAEEDEKESTSASSVVLDPCAIEAQQFDTTECLNKPLALIGWIMIAAQQMNSDQLSCLMMVFIIKSTIWRGGSFTTRSEHLKPFLTYLYNLFLAKDQVNVGGSALVAALMSVRRMLGRPCSEWHPKVMDALVSDLSLLIQTNNSGRLTVKDRLHLKSLCNHQDSFLFQSQEFFVATEAVLINAYNVMLTNQSRYNRLAEERDKKKRNTPSMRGVEALVDSLPGSAPQVPKVEPVSKQGTLSNLSLARTSMHPSMATLQRTPTLPSAGAFALAIAAGAVPGTVPSAANSARSSAKRSPGKSSPAGMAIYALTIAE